jgi:hypothetical protein
MLNVRMLLSSTSPTSPVFFFLPNIEKQDDKHRYILFLVLRFNSNFPFEASIINSIVVSSAPPSINPRNTPFFSSSICDDSSTKYNKVFIAKSFFTKPVRLLVETPFDLTCSTPSITTGNAFMSVCSETITIFFASKASLTLTKSSSSISCSISILIH